MTTTTSDVGPTDRWLDPGCLVEPTPDLRSVDGGRILIGGSPLRILRLGVDGAPLVQRWFAGQPVGPHPAHQALARRLEAGGLAHLRWPPMAASPAYPIEVTVVIPTHDDGEELHRTLASGVEAWAGEIVVVDDGSTRPADPGRSPNVRLLRRQQTGGPGPARQEGLEAVDTALVIFIDAGVVVPAETAAGLVSAFDDPAVVAAAPRIRSAPLPHLTGRYDARRSPLDLGPVESLVGPGRSVTYVPTACLAVRRAAVAQIGGFDPELRYGEDVDLVWRLARIGHVCYLPELTATHRPRSSLRALAAQRRAYGSAAAALALRHGTEPLAPCRVSGWTALAVGLALAGRPLAAGATAVGTGLALGAKLEPMPNARAEGVALALRGHWYGGWSILAALTRSWAPAALLALGSGPRVRRIVAIGMAAGSARRLLDGPRRPADATIDLAVGVVDDLASCVGLWEGALRHRSGAALWPVVASWPDPAPGLRSRLGAVGRALRTAIRR